MFNPQLVEWDRVKHIANAVVDSVKQLKLSIETSHTKLNAAMLREQTMANANVILALYKDEHPKDYSAPTIVIAEKDNEVGAAVVRTCYNKTLKKTEMSTMFRGSSCSSDFKALESLYKRSRAKLARAIELSKNDEGFDFWDDL